MAPTHPRPHVNLKHVMERMAHQPSDLRQLKEEHGNGCCQINGCEQGNQRSPCAIRFAVFQKKEPTGEDTDARDQQNCSLHAVAASNSVWKKENNQYDDAPQKETDANVKQVPPVHSGVTKYIHRLGRYTSVLVPKKTSADSMIVSDSVG